MITWIIFCVDIFREIFIFPDNDGYFGSKSRNIAVPCLKFCRMRRCLALPYMKKSCKIVRIKTGVLKGNMVITAQV